MQSKNKAANRKVSIFYILPKDLDREDEILGIKKTVEVPKPKPEILFPEKIVLDNPDGTQSQINLNVAFMKQVSNARVGEKLKLDNLNFYNNSFGITLDSRDKLYELLIIMEKNPALKIDIQGHLCCNPIDKQNLSRQRAKAVYGFLVANNIDKSRISYKGFGSTQPIYSLPEKTDEEKATNRRVEIMIVEN
jgi:outer membrane protein OmpA-like peptidoglycan-associated protein